MLSLSYTRDCSITGSASVGEVIGSILGPGRIMSKTLNVALTADISDARHNSMSRGKGECLVKTGCITRDSFYFERKVVQ